MRNELRKGVSAFLNRNFQEIKKDEEYQIIKVNDNEAIAIDFKQEEIFYINSKANTFVFKKINS